MPAFFFLLAHPIPKVFFLIDVDVAWNTVRHIVVAEKHIAVQVRTIWRGGPFKADDRRKNARFIRLFRRVLDHFPRGFGRRWPSIKRRMLWSGRSVRRDHIFEKPLLTLLDVRHGSQFFKVCVVVPGSIFEHRGVHLADVFRVIGHRRKIQWALMLHHGTIRHCDRIALGETVGVRRHQTRATDVGVERKGCVHMRLAEIGVAERVGFSNRA